MPQMSPMLWMILFMTSITLLHYIMINLNFFYMIKPSHSKTIEKIKTNWKW